MHGTPQAVGLWSEETNMSPRFLAEIIIHNPKYEKGQKVRLLSCNTGKGIPFDDCFAQKLANEINAPVVAPTDILWVFDNGRMEIGKYNQGEWKEFVPIYR